MKIFFTLFILGISLAFTTFSVLPSKENAVNPAPAIATYEKAVLLLHNFQYDDAAELFIETQKEHPDVVLAYWGEAMTYDHPVWGDVDIDKSRAALRKLGSTPADRVSKGKTPLEKDLIQSIEILFGEGSKPERQKKYAEFMKSLYTKYPNNNEITAFYSLSLLGVKEGWDNWEEYNVEAARLASEVLKTDPNHPGGLHYLVHANDHPQHAKDGLDAANRYAIAASYATHALHMPSHIYLALGKWDDVVRSNEISWKASVDRKIAKKLSNNGYGYHSHLWLHYGYLQQGRYSKAKEILDNQLRFTNELPSAVARVHLLQMKGHYLFETDDWSSALADLPIKTEDLMTESQYNAVFLEAYQTFLKKDVAKFQKILSDFEKKLGTDSQMQKANENVTICGVTRFVNAVPTEDDIQSGRKLLNTLYGMDAWMRNDLVKADQYFRESLPKEGSVVIGPLFNLLSAHESYGRFLLATNKPDEAYQQFGKALLASPNRIIALKGQLKAARMMKDSSKVMELTTQLQKNLAKGDELAKKDI